VIVVIFTTRLAAISARCSTTTGCAKRVHREERHDRARSGSRALSGELCSIEANEPVEHALR
jgi:hypothetical protein